MKSINIFLITLGLIIFTVSSQAAKNGMQLNDLGMDGENRLYDLVCLSCKGTTLFHHVGFGALENTEELAVDEETINIEIYILFNCFYYYRLRAHISLKNFNRISL